MKEELEVAHIHSVQWSMFPWPHPAMRKLQDVNGNAESDFCGETAVKEIWKTSRNFTHNLKVPEILEKDLLYPFGI